jgi:hypothetical protein
MEARGFDRAGEWHLHPDGDDRPSDHDLLHWSYWRKQLGLQRFFGVIGGVQSDRELRVSAWLVTAGPFVGRDTCRRARVRGGMKRRGRS